MVTAVKQRFGRLNRLPKTFEWLTDNGSCYAAADTHRFAREIGFLPLRTPIESPQFNGMAEALVPKQMTTRGDLLLPRINKQLSGYLREIPVTVAQAQGRLPSATSSPR